MSEMIENVDKQIKKLIKSCIKRNHRSLFVILGSQASKQVPVFIHLLKQRKVKEISWLWCSKETSDVFQIKNKSNLRSLQTLSSEGEKNVVEPYYCSYSDMDKIAHRYFNFAVLQDFDALTVQTLSLVTDAVKGGGIIVFLLHNLSTLDDILKLNLNVVYKPSQFCKRFAVLLNSCSDSIILDENLSVLSSGFKFVENQEESYLTSQAKKMEELQLKSEHDTITRSLLGICKTPEQAKLLLQFLDVIKKKTIHSVCSVSSPVGRGKSAALGLAIAGSLALNYSNIFISSMLHSNVQTVFKFLLLGLDVLNYKEDTDFDLIESLNPKFKKALIGLNLFRDHPQSVRFILPGDIGEKLKQAELVIFDEAAGIPIQIIKPLFGPYVVLMSSSTSGSGASSPYLYKSLVNTIQPSFALPHENDKFQVFTLEEPINYNAGDSIESWINNVLQVEPAVTTLLSCGYPLPEQCRLFCVNRDILFSGSSQAESFLKSLMSVLSSSERVINPDLLLKLADSPDYAIFCLLPSLSNTTKICPEIICAILVHLENEIPEHIIHCGTNLNEFTSHCFNEWKRETMISYPSFSPIQGIHILNIVTHHSHRKMGYGMRAFQLLQDFYEGKCISLDENLELKCKLKENTSLVKNMIVDSGPPLLQQLTDIQPKNIDYFLVTFSLTSETLRFWKKAAFIPAFITDKVNSEGEHTLFMVKGIVENFDQVSQKCWSCFQKHFCVLLGSAFKHFPASLALNFVHFNVPLARKNVIGLTKEDIDVLIRPHRMKSLLKYCQNLQDFHSVLQFIPIISNLYFKNYFKDIALSRVQEAILLSFGLQFKVADEISKDLDLPNMQIYGLLNRTIKKLVKFLNDIIEKSVEKTLEAPEVIMEPITEDLDDELEEAAQEIREQQKSYAKELLDSDASLNTIKNSEATKKIQEQQEIGAKKLLELDMSQYAIKGSEDDWQKALFSGRKAHVSIKSIKKPPNDSVEKVIGGQQNFKKNKKQKKQRR